VSPRAAPPLAPHTHTPPLAQPARPPRATPATAVAASARPAVAAATVAACQPPPAQAQQEGRAPALPGSLQALARQRCQEALQRDFQFEPCFDGDDFSAAVAAEYQPPRPDPAAGSGGQRDGRDGAALCQQAQGAASPAAAAAAKPASPRLVAASVSGELAGHGSCPRRSVIRPVEGPQGRGWMFAAPADGGSGSADDFNGSMGVAALRLAQDAVVRVPGDSLRRLQHQGRHSEWQEGGAAWHSSGLPVRQGGGRRLAAAIAALRAPRDLLQGGKQG
jgi:hypothetical protein